jgi:hypothetical protein
VNKLIYFRRDIIKQIKKEQAERKEDERIGPIVSTS